MTRNIGSRYVAHKVLGRGASGTVWRGEGPEGPVAIKLLREDLACDQELVGRFVQERTALTSLEHRNIVGIHELVVDGADLALVMDLVEGPDLRTRLERDQVCEPALAVGIVADVADALAAAHAEGVIHRDVKPENVLLDERDGELSARLTDFGIARLVDSPRRTRATRIIGTPDYLAPEIIEGCRVTAAVDIYALGTLCYELLTGWTPFGHGHPGAVLRRHVTEAVPGIPGLPDALAVVLSSCLSKAPAARPRAAEMAAALRESLPELAGMPAFDVPDPHADDLDEYEPVAMGARSVADEDGVGGARGGGARGGGARGGGPAGRTLGRRPDREQPRRAPLAATGAVPLVPAARDGFVRRSEAGAYSRQTHLGLRRPQPHELAPAGPARAVTRRRAVLASIAAAAVLVLFTGGGYLLATKGFGRGVSDGAQPVGAATRLPTPGASGASASHAPDDSTAAARPLSWSSVSGLPAAPDALTGGVSASAMPGGREYVFARGVGGDLWYVTAQDGRFGGWQRLSGLRTSFEPAVVAAAGRIDVFAVGQSDASLWRRTFTGGAWGHWNRLGGRVRITQPPAAVSIGPDRVEVLARTVGDTLVAGSLDKDHWQDFTQVPEAGRIMAAPALAAAGGALDAFVVRASDGELLRLSYSDGIWQRPLAVGGVSASRPTATRLDDGRLLVLTRSAAGRISAHMLTGASWRRSDLGLDSPAAASVISAGDRVDVFARRSGARLQHVSGR